MNRLISILLSITDDLIPLFRPSDRGGFISLVFLVAANAVPAIGVILLDWDPYMILFIYWGESLIAGFFNVLKMLISGAIENGAFSRSGLGQGIGLSLFFTLHYGIFMLVHLIFLVVFMFFTGFKGGGNYNPFNSFVSFFPAGFSLIEVIDSEFSAVIAIFISYAVSFYFQFIKTGAYNHTAAPDYMMRPYKRIVVMHLTIIFGAFVFLLSGFKSGLFVVVWIALRIFADLKMHARETASAFMIQGVKTAPER